MTVTSESFHKVQPLFSYSGKKQKTLKHTVSYNGVGLFTGCKVRMLLKPAPEGNGIRFKRVDLPGNPEVPARVENVKETPRSTILEKNKVEVRSVEHVLSALKAYEIDNAFIEMDAIEVPACDGSATPFVELIEKSGVSCQVEEKKLFRLSTPIFWSQGDVHLVALPSDDFRVSYTLSYPNSNLLRSQFYTFHVNEESYKNEIAPSRTFSLYEEIIPLVENGLVKGGTLDNGVIIKRDPIKGDSVINPEGLRFEDEMVRHKILDLIGDLSLVGENILAHIIAIRSGHFSNTAFAKEIANYIKLEKGK
ncbi:MAG: UDP-3-O-acyl-N-acetylglucosamine deacetylase [Simkaniaceae bacterium]